MFDAHFLANVRLLIFPARILTVAGSVALVTGCGAGTPDASAPSETGREIIQIERSQTELVLEAVVHDVVNNPALNAIREFYGTEGDKHLALVSNAGYGIPWPADFDPHLEGWSVTRVEEAGARDKKAPRMLGVRIDKFSIEGAAATELFRAPIEVTVLNGGGNKNGTVIGGCSVYYTPRQGGGKWLIKYEGAMDP